MKTKLILYLFRKLSVSQQQSLTRYLVGTVFPGLRLYKARPSGYRRARKGSHDTGNQ